MRRVSVRALACALVVSGVGAVGERAAAAPQNVVVDEIGDFRRTTWHWQRVTGRRLTPTEYSERRVRDAEYRRWVLNLWRNRARAIWRVATNPPHEGAWRCIHRFEGAWNAATGNGYYGGLQMDYGFQASYGGYLLRKKGTANNWTPLEQMWVAERALRSGRGFYPWPNASRMCGLI